MDRGGGYVVVDVDVKRGQRKEVLVLAAAERRDAGLAQRLADIDVLPRSCGFRRPRARPVGRVRRCRRSPRVGACRRARRSRQARSALRGSRRESPRTDAPHGGASVRRRARSWAGRSTFPLRRCVNGRRAEARRRCDQNSGSESGSAARLGRRAARHAARALAAAGAVPFHTSTSSTGLSSGSSAGDRPTSRSSSFGR